MTVQLMVGVGVLQYILFCRHTHLQLVYKHLPTNLLPIIGLLRHLCARGPQNYDVYITAYVALRLTVGIMRFDSRRN